MCHCRSTWIAVYVAEARWLLRRLERYEDDKAKVWIGLSIGLCLSRMHRKQ